MTEPLLPYTAWEFVAIVGGLVIASAMYGPACRFLRLYRAGMKKDDAGGGANGPVWLAAGCAVSSALGATMLITTVVVAAAALDSDPYDGYPSVAVLFIFGVMMYVFTAWSAWSEFYTSRGMALSTGIVGLSSVALYASGLLVVFGLMPVIDWCTVFTCVPGGDLTK